MESFYFLVPIALIFVAIALRLLFWALNNGQYDNLDTEAHRILFDEDPAAQTDNNSAVSEQTDEQITDVNKTTIAPTSLTSASVKATPHD